MTNNTDDCLVFTLLRVCKEVHVVVDCTARKKNRNRSLCSNFKAINISDVRAEFNTQDRLYGVAVHHCARIPCL